MYGGKIPLQNDRNHVQKAHFLIRSGPTRGKLMAGRKNLLRPTAKKPVKFSVVDGEERAKTKKASLDDGSKLTIKETQAMTIEQNKEKIKEPVDRSFIYVIGALAFVIGILLLASLSNSNKFYFKQNDRMVELWQGRFAPMGEGRVASFSDLKILEVAPEDKTYNKKQAFGILSDSFIKRADELLSAGVAPDLKTVKSYLTHASKYVTSESQRRAIRMRLDRIEFVGLLGKTDLAVKGPAPDFEAARIYLTRAILLAPTDLQRDGLRRRLAAVEYALATSKISKGERQLADLYREALNRHLQKAREYGPDKSEEIDQEITKIKKWLDEFDKKQAEVRE